MNNFNRRFGVLREFQENGQTIQSLRLDGSIHIPFKQNKIIQDIMLTKGSCCYFCGFFDKFFLEPHHLDGNHTNHSEENIVPACTLCHSQNHIFSLALEKKAEICVLSDDFTQEQFNHMQRVLLVLSHDLMKDINQDIYHFSKKTLEGLMMEPLKAHMRPNAATITEKEYIELMFKDIEVYENAKINQAKVDEKLYFTNGFFKTQAAFKEAVDGDSSSAIAKYTAQIKKYKEWYINRIRENKNFSLYQLAKSLDQLTDQEYEKVSLPNHYILFNHNIFTQEQYEYYLTHPSIIESLRQGGVEINTPNYTSQEG